MNSLRLIVLFLVLAFATNAQVDSVYYGTNNKRQNEKPKEPKNDAWKEKVTWGGNVQAWLGNPTFILLSPTMGYIPFRNFNVGIGAIYNYISYNSYYGSYKQSIFGGHSYARYIIAENYFVQVQYDRLHQPDLYSLDPGDKLWMNYVLVGGGFTQSVSDRVSLNTSIMYNVHVTDPLLSIYPSRVIVQFGVVGTF